MDPAQANRLHHMHLAQYVDFMQTGDLEGRPEQRLHRGVDLLHEQVGLPYQYLP